MTAKWSERYAERARGMKSSAIREILKITQLPDVISFAGGLPAPELFPIQEVNEATQRVLETRGQLALQYSPTEGYMPLRAMVADQLQQEGVSCGPDNVLITSGSQQALDLIGKLFIDSGDHIIVEDPTYLGALQAWNAYQGQYLTTAKDDDGMQPAALEQTIKSSDAKFIYALPNYQNPTGSSLTHERRVEVVRLAEQYNIPIVEDDPYGQLYYEDESKQSLLALDAANHEQPGEIITIGNVIYLSTFSKTLCPGFRVAWIVAPTEVLNRMVQAKQGVDLHTSTFAQMVAYETARDGFLESHVAMLRKVYRERRDLMLGLIEETFPTEGVTWTHPQGGLFLWVRLPESIDTTELLATAVEHKVAFVPGGPFHPNGGGTNTMRLNFSNATDEKIEVGILRLAEVIKAALIQ